VKQKVTEAVEENKGTRRRRNGVIESATVDRNLPERDVQKLTGLREMAKGTVKCMNGMKKLM